MAKIPCLPRPPPTQNSSSLVFLYLAEVKLLALSMYSKVMVNGIWFCATVPHFLELVHKFLASCVGLRSSIGCNKDWVEEYFRKRYTLCKET